MNQERIKIADLVPLISQRLRAHRSARGALWLGSSPTSLPLRMSPSLGIVRGSHRNME